MIFIAIPAGFSIVFVKGLQYLGLSLLLSWIIILIVLIILLIIISSYEIFKLYKTE